MDQLPKILVVDDHPTNIKLLEALLGPEGYRVEPATSGPEALAKIAHDPPDLILLDVLMPGMDGYETCERIRQEPASAMLPVIMITAVDDQEKLSGLQAGADDFITKPMNQDELLARVRSLIRIKRYQDTIAQQAAELRELNQSLEARVQQQVEELQRLGRLRRFLSPPIAEVICSSGSDELLASHRREITVAFCDLRGFTAFAERAEPEEVMRVLRQYHQAMGELIFAYEGTLERFAGDGLMVFFNDPMPVSDPAERAVSMAVAMRERADTLIQGWRRQGFDLAFGVGIAMGFATLGQIGFEGRWDYAAVGTVTNLAARLCDEAHAGQILIGQRVLAAVEDRVEAELLGDLPLKGFLRPTPAYNVLRLRPPTDASIEGGTISSPWMATS